MFVNCRFFSIAAVMSLFLLMSFPVAAQESSPQDIKDAELEKAVEAYLKVVDIGETFQESIQGVEDQSKRAELQEKANKEMTTAIEDTGLDIESYNSIIAQVRSDSDTRDRFYEKLEKFE